MKTDTLKGNWTSAKAKLKQKYSQLSDADLTFKEGREDELLERLQKKTGRSRAEIEAFLEEECGCRDVDASEPGRDPNRRDWHEERIEQGRAVAQKTAPPKNWEQQNEEQRAGLGANQQRTASPTKDHSGGGQHSPSGHPGDRDHGREAEQAKSMQNTPDQGGTRPIEQRGEKSSGRPGAKGDESGQPGHERAEQRVQRPGEAGLANENRPGLGTRADPTQNKPEQLGRGAQAQGGSRSAQPAEQAKAGAAESAKKDDKGRSASDLGADTSRPKPNEQNSQSLEQEQQRSTGMSGQSSGV